MSTPSREDSLRKLKITSDLFDFAYQVKRHQLRQKHPEYDEKRLHEETIKLIRKACE
jgi:hypothetical protein